MTTGRNSPYELKKAVDLGPVIAYLDTSDFFNEPGAIITPIDNCGTNP